MDIILGPPGTGKTTTLLNRVQKSLEDGVQPGRIAFVAFTRRAATEAITRACDKFSFKESDLPYFRTLHSLAFRSLGLSKAQVMDSKKTKEFGELMGIRISGYVSMDDGNVFGTSEGDRMLFMDNLARVRGITLLEQWQEDSDNLPWFSVDRVSRGLVEYKDANNLVDFTDMLSTFVARDNCPDLDLLVVDEAQDLSALQWRVVDKLREKSEQTITAGDDDQAIFRWAGADVDNFIGLPGAVTVLNQSYRVPRLVQDLANNVIGKVNNRRPKEWAPVPEDGTITWCRTTRELDFSTGQWLVLARNSYFLKDVEDMCRVGGFIYERSNGSRSMGASTIRAIRAWTTLSNGRTISRGDALEVYKRTSGVNHGFRKKLQDAGDVESFSLNFLRNDYGLVAEGIWHEALDRISLHDRAYLVAALRREEDLLGPPRIKLSTIHGSKGGECENVVLLTDMAPRTYREAQYTPDDEARVWYVALTRTQKSLFIVSNSTKYYFASLFH